MLRIKIYEAADKIMFGNKEDKGMQANTEQSFMKKLKKRYKG